MHILPEVAVASRRANACDNLMGKGYHRHFCVSKRSELSIRNWASITRLSLPCRLMAAQQVAAAKNTASTMKA